MDRRTFLRTSLGAGALAALAPRPSAALPLAPGQDAGDSPFRHGVASGDPFPDSVVLWTRLTLPAAAAAGDVAVRWVLAHDVDLTDVVATGETIATAARDHTVKIVPGGLAGYTTYYFAFEVDLGGTTWRSLTGRTRTSPAPGQAVDRLRFAVTSCANLGGGRIFNAYRLLCEKDVDAVFALGDYYYEYGGDELEPTLEITTLADYRVRHGFYKRDADLQRAHQLFPWIVAWDDHESANNSWFGGANNHSRDGTDPNETDGGTRPAQEPIDEGPWEQRKAWAQQAYDEWMPLRVTDPAVIYRRVPYGDLVDVLVLDTRLDGRDLQAEGLDGETGSVDAAVNDPDRAMLSDAQRSWFFDALTTSTARWRIVGNQVMMSQLRLVNLPQTLSDLLLLPTGDEPQLALVQSGGVIAATDLWDGYIAERERVFDHVKQQGVENVVVITGDIHTSWANDLYSDPLVDQVATAAGIADLHVGVEFVTPGITSSGFPPEVASILEPLIPTQNPGTRFAELTRKGYVVLDVTPDRVQADWWWVATVDERSDQEEHGASWVTRHGANPLVAASTPTRPRAGVAPDPSAALPGQDAGAGDPTTGSGGAPGGTGSPSAGPGTLPATGGPALPALGFAAGAAGVAATLARRRAVRGGSAAEVEAQPEVAEPHQT